MTPRSFRPVHPTKGQSSLRGSKPSRQVPCVALDDVARDLASHPSVCIPCAANSKRVSCKSKLPANSPPVPLESFVQVVIMAHSALRGSDMLHQREMAKEMRKESGGNRTRQTPLRSEATGQERLREGSSPRRSASRTRRRNPSPSPSPSRNPSRSQNRSWCRRGW